MTRERHQYAAMCDRLGEALEQVAWVTVSGTKGNILANAALQEWKRMKGNGNGNGNVNT